MSIGYGNSSNSILKQGKTVTNINLLYKSTTFTRIDWLFTDLRFMLRARLLISKSDEWCCGRAFALHLWHRAIKDRGRDQLIN